jgi:ribosome-binding factor A
MRRSDRVGDELRNVISQIIRDRLRDPRIPQIVSITEVRVTRDLSHADVYFSVYGGEDEKKGCTDALTSAASFIRREVGAAMKLRVLPELHFKLDESIEKAMHISRLIDETIRKQEKPQGE